MSNGSAYKEGATLTPLTASAVDRAYERKLEQAATSLQDTDDNALDFVLITPSTPSSLGLTLTTPSLDFGSVAKHVSASLNATIKNNYFGAAVTLTTPFGIDGPDAAEFSAGSPAATSMAEGTSTSVPVTFTPVTIGPKTATLHITSTNGGSPAIALSGLGACPVIAVAASLPNAEAGVFYTQPLSASGGVGPYLFSMTAGSLPVGVSLSPAGVLSGSTTATGTFNLNVQATEDDGTETGGCSGSAPFTLVVADTIAPAITVTTPAASGIYQQNQSVLASYACTDTGTDVASCAGTVANGSALDTSTLGSKTFVVNATDNAGNPSSTTVSYEVRRTLTAVGPANVWFGLKNSDDVGLLLDLRSELLVNGVVAASGDLNNINPGGSGFNNAVLRSIAMSLSAGSVDIPAGAQLAVRVSARRTCFGGGHNSGTAREWFNGQLLDSGAGRDAGSRVQLTLAGTTSTYFLRSAFGLATAAGAARQSVDVTLNSGVACPARPFTPFGMWSVTLP